MIGAMLAGLLACSGSREPASAPTPAEDATTAPTPPPPEQPARTPPRDGVMVTSPNGLCGTGEVVYFSCPLAAARVASLCGTADLTGASAALQLRIGRQQSDPEIRFPPGTARSVDTFEGARSGGVLAVRVSTGRMGYEVFRDGEGGGVTTAAPNGTRTDERCIATPIGDLNGVLAAVEGVSFWR
jgi:hypothetical protein